MMRKRAPRQLGLQLRVCAPCVVVAALLWAASPQLAAAPAQRKLAAEDGETSPLVGARVIVELASGKEMPERRIVAARPGKVGGTVGGLILADLETGSRTTCGAAGIKRVKSVAGNVLLVYDEAAKSLVSPNAKDLESIRAAAQAAAQASAKPAPQTRAKPEPKKPAKGKEPEQKTPEEKEKERQEIFEKTGVMPWAELTDEEQKKATDAQKEYLKKVTDASKLPMQLQETKFFLFLSDIPPQQTAMYVPYLDQMYVKLCEAYGIPKDTNIWQGKGVVIAFLTKEAFHGYEIAFFGEPKIGAAGLAHLSGDGNVVISCFRGESPTFFASVLVHETAHGFMFRYKSPAQLPIWLEEGAADWIASAIVTSDKTILRRQQKAIQNMRMSGTMGGVLDAQQAILGGDFYGTSSSLTDFLLRKDPKRFRKMLEAIKLNTPWEKALQNAYGWTPADVATRYGEAIGAPYLRP